MLSLFSLAGFGADGTAVPAEYIPDEEFLYQSEGWAQPGDASMADNLLHADEDAAEAAASGESQDYQRGDRIAGFDPRTDTLELEYTRALGRPEVTVSDFADGTGASIALNGVVVADVAGAQGLSPESIVLVAV